MCIQRRLIGYTGCGHHSSDRSTICPLELDGECPWIPTSYFRKNGDCPSCSSDMASEVRLKFNPGEMKLLAESLTTHNLFYSMYLLSLDCIEEKDEAVLRREERFLTTYVINPSNGRIKHVRDGRALIRMRFLHDRLFESGSDEVKPGNEARVKALSLALKHMPYSLVDRGRSAKMIKAFVHTWIRIINNLGNTTWKEAAESTYRLEQLLIDLKYKEDGSFQDKYLQQAYEVVGSERASLRLSRSIATHGFFAERQAERMRRWEGEYGNHNSTNLGRGRGWKAEWTRILRNALFEVDVSTIEGNEYDRRCATCLGACGTSEDPETPPEKAVRLPCGHVAGLDCLIATTLEKGVQCPFGRCLPAQDLELILPRRSDFVPIYPMPQLFAAEDREAWSREWETRALEIRVRLKKMPLREV